MREAGIRAALEEAARPAAARELVRAQVGLAHAPPSTRVALEDLDVHAARHREPRAPRAPALRRRAAHGVYFARLLLKVLPAHFRFIYS